MLDVAYWCDVCQRHHFHVFVSPYLPSIDEGGPGESYWFPAWGTNPYLATDGNFNPEWN